MANTDNISATDSVKDVSITHGRTQTFRSPCPQTGAMSCTRFADQVNVVKGTSKV